MPADDDRLQKLAERSGVSLLELVARADAIVAWAEAAGLSVPQLMQELFRGGKRWRGGAAQRPSDDARTAKWHVRLRLVAPSNDVIADSDPDRDPTEAGADVVAGLRGVMTWIADVLQVSRPDIYSNALRVEIADRIPSLRVALARRQNGTAVFKIPIDRRDVAFARVDVVRSDTAPAVERRQMTLRRQAEGEANGRGHETP